MGIAIANRKNRCDFGVLGSPKVHVVASLSNGEVGERATDLHRMAKCMSFCPHPLSFLSLFFGKSHGKPPKKNKDFLSLPNP